MPGVKAPRIGNSQSDFWQALFPGTSQKISTAATASQSAAFGSTTTMVRLYATKDCHVAFGTNPTADASGSGGMFLPSAIAVNIGVVVSTKLSVIRDAADGVLYITEATGVS